MSQPDGGSAAARYWSRTVRATLLLVAAWALVTLGLPALASIEWRVFGFPLGYWLIAQGSLLLYLAIVVAYALWMERIEQRVGAPRDDAGRRG